MRKKAFAVAVVAGLSIILFMAMRSENRADAAAGNCYASAQGPSAPTICQESGFRDAPLRRCYGATMAEPTTRTLAGVALILLLIGVWAAFVASLARVVGGWPILVQAPFYLVMGIIWIIPLKPLLRWIQTGSFRDGSRGQ